MTTVNGIDRRPQSLDFKNRRKTGAHFSTHALVHHGKEIPKLTCAGGVVGGKMHAATNVTKILRFLIFSNRSRRRRRLLPHSPSARVLIFNPLHSFPLRRATQHSSIDHHLLLVENVATCPRTKLNELIQKAGRILPI